MGLLGYGDATYWDQRYWDSKGDVFDWYMNYSRIKGLFDEELPGARDGQVLQIGCGNSRIQEQMVEDGYKHIDNIDISAVVIDQMNARCEGMRGLTFRTMDVRRMEFEDDSFDVVLDKGTLDAILCGEASYANSRRALRECVRVLRPGGQFVSITYGKPDSRLQYFAREEYGFDIKMYCMAKKWHSRRQKRQNAPPVPGSAADPQQPSPSGIGSSAAPDPSEVEVYGPYTIQQASQVVRLGAGVDMHYLYFCRVPQEKARVPTRNPSGSEASAGTGQMGSDESEDYDSDEATATTGSESESDYGNDDYGCVTGGPAGRGLPAYGRSSVVGRRQGN